MATFCGCAVGVSTHSKAEGFATPARWLKPTACPGSGGGALWAQSSTKSSSAMAPRSPSSCRSIVKAPVL